METIKFKAWDNFNQQWLKEGEVLVDSFGKTFWNNKEYPNLEETDTIDIILIKEKTTIIPDVPDNELKKLNEGF